ncbi:MAG TPA: PilN domain-containing protein [Terriglobia bacterium]|nr:PilN domain-containing protein [Terriglobia bacterium]
MIKINLLEGARAHPDTKVKLEGPVSLPAFQAKVFGVALGSLAIVVSFFYWYWTRQINHLNDNLRAEQAEAARLKGIQAENERYAKQLSEMEQRIKTIQALESSRKGPVELMASLGATVNNTRGLYLLSVSTQENQINVQGQSPTVDAIAGFIAALRNSGKFQDVRLEQYFENDQKEQVGFKFILDCLYQTVPQVGSPQPPTGLSRPAPGPAPAAGAPTGPPGAPALPQPVRG